MNFLPSVPDTLPDDVSQEEEDNRIWVSDVDKLQADTPEHLMLAAISVCQDFDEKEIVGL